ncbi:hypothetical protein D9757_010418 [Collybiopsis confluens]|uniref:Uncharacterized protein n=1 Tax=Collybiopsis confluens TaxID=2823264 RepID=A0A8H5LTB2_9AGAR|nr:hypothetical protein D9757_010418 [Collybiopsis confluens]
MSVITASNPLPAQSHAPLPEEKCYICKGKPAPGYKSCTKCRQKQNERSRKQNERSRQQKQKLKAQIALTSKWENEPVKPAMEASELKRKAEDGGNAEEREKKRAKRVLKAYRRMDTQRTVSGNTSQHDTMEFGVEFQTASELYQRLKKLVRKDICINFQACHSIVADPSYNHGKRASLVARDISKICKVPFDYKITLAPAISSRTSHSLRYNCACKSPDFDAKSTSSVRKRDAYFAKIFGSGPSQASPSAPTSQVSCQGTIEVTIMDDNRHPVGIPGQQIRVHIRH